MTRYDARTIHTDQRRGFTLIELLVVIAVIAILVGLLMSSVQAARQAARRLQCKNNLHQMGIGMHNYHELHRCFPPGGLEPRHVMPNGRQFAWSAFMLAEVGQGVLADKIDFNKPFDDPDNAEAAATVLPMYLCPSVPRTSNLREGRGACDYGGIYGERISGPNDPPRGVMLYDRVIRMRDIRDGTSTTLAVSEDSNFRDGQWINGRNIFDQAFAINRAPSFENDIRSEHPGGANGLMCDGSARFLNENIDLQILAALCTRASGEVIGEF